ncbi:hypothetical protein, partial [Mesorhizobium sp.]|uniref:hypothetical protein n=1 Tax=Mesorhizobium sp. TaxID=1871066 RepID=UPI0025E6F57F
AAAAATSAPASQSLSLFDLFEFARGMLQAAAVEVSFGYAFMTNLPLCCPPQPKVIPGPPPESRF